MEAVNKKYNIEIEVLTPLSIGAGAEKDWVKGADFVVRDGHLYKLSLKKMVANGVDLSLLTSYFASKNSNAIVKLLGGKLETVSDSCIDMPADSENDIKAFVKNQLSGNPVVPGSSLKGAVRSVLFQYLGGSSKDGKEVFGSSTEGDEFMRFIKISDAEFEETALVNTKIFNLQRQGSWKGGWKHGNSMTDSKFSQTGFNTLYESLMPHQKGYASLMMSEKLFDNYEKNKKAHIKTEKKRPVLHDDIPLLFGIINKHTKEYLLKEKNFFLKYSTDKTDKIVESIDNLLKQIPKDNSSCILKMSAGSGFHSITGDWQFENYTEGVLDRKRNWEGKVLPKSRKIAIYGDSMSLMGFVKLKPVTQKEIDEAKSLKEQKIKEAENQKRREQEDVLEKQRLMEERKMQFAEAIRQVGMLMVQKEFESALTLLDDTKAKYPDLKQNELDEEELRHEVENIHYEREQKAEQERKEQELEVAKQQRVAAGLESFLNEKYEFGPNVGKFKVVDWKVCANKVNSWIKSAGAKQIPIEQQPPLLSALRRIYEGLNPKEKQKNWSVISSNIWRQIISWVGEETAANWFNELTQ